MAQSATATPLVVRKDVQKHYGYAFQWFALAAGIAFLYVWHRFIRPAKP